MDLEKINIKGIDDIYTLSVVRKEFKKAAGEQWNYSPPLKKYQARLIQNLAVLSVYRLKAIDFPQFEKLTGVDNLYSMRFVNSDKNIRVLYTFEGNSIILLAAFLEKNTSDYKNAISKAQSRIRLLNDNTDI